MFQSQVRFPVIASFDFDPAADDILPVFRAPADCTIKAAYVTLANDVAGSGTNYFSVTLQNGGAAGTATAALSAAAGGTAGWTGLTPVAFTLGTSTVDAGEVVTISYDEEGTGTFGAMTVQLDIVYGA
jgi:hypothetical protein